MYVQPINNVLTNHWDIFVIKEHVKMFNVAHLPSVVDLDYLIPTV